MNIYLKFFFFLASANLKSWSHPASNKTVVATNLLKHEAYQDHIKWKTQNIELMVGGLIYP